MTRARRALEAEKETLKDSVAEAQDEVKRERTKREAAEDDVLCIVCSEKRRKKALVPCMHLSLCQDCDGGEQCPICRAPVQGSVAVFLS